jgi:tight adherence protein B
MNFMTPIIILGSGGVLVLLLLFIGIIISVSSDRAESAIEERIDRLTTAEKDELKNNREAKTPLTDWINNRVEGSSLADRIAKTLARADLKMKPGEYIALVIIAAFGVGFIVWFIGGKSMIGGIVGAAIGYFLPGFYVRRQQKQRLKKFDDQLPDMLNLMVNGLRAGYSTMQAMEAVSKELAPPICDEFRRVVQEMQLGVPMERALDNLLRRIPSDDLDFVVTAVNVQREVGGNLAEIMDTISYTIRERIRIKGEIRVLTTQVMYSGKFLSVMPLGVIGILYLMNRPYLEQFFKYGWCGYAPLGCSALLIAAGYFVMNKLGEIEI